MKQLELLAPAGSLTALKAVVNAGADAVYLGGERFGARAYANNFTKEELLEGIDYGHRFGSRVILAVNTLLKEEEIKEQLYDYLLPYYEHGIDAVIVQDFGVFCFLREQFPDLPLHASTQMTVAGVDGAKLLADLGAARIVMARELSFSEIAAIHETVDAELEGFVHGALCYCYSGQCLLSSMLGGRSGNRGRCAQPCRLPYEVQEKDGRRIGKKENYVLSPKDLCTIDDIPQLAEAGLYSFKIEGRMKQAEYAAGVVHIYRKYMDRYLQYGKEDFHVAEEDKKALLALGNRSGFTDGYYRRHNGREMITFDRPGHTKADPAQTEAIVRAYITTDKKEEICGRLTLKKGEPAALTVSTKDKEAHVLGEMAAPAKTSPLTEEILREKITKTGNTPYCFKKLDVEMDADVFLPVQALNRLRRDALTALQEEEQKTCARKCVPPIPYPLFERQKRQEPYLAVLTEQEGAFWAACASAFVKRIYLDGGMFCPPEPAWEVRQWVTQIHAAGKEAYYAFPHVFRARTREHFLARWEELLEAKPDGFLIRSYDELGFCLQMGVPAEQLILDHNLYTWSDAAKSAYRRLGITADTAPVELNRHELLARANTNSELILYGSLPLMMSAQCVHANLEGCDQKRTVRYLRDRYGKRFTLKNDCSDCYMVLYNSSPLSLLHQRAEIAPMGFAGYRLQFTTETKQQIENVLAHYKTWWEEGKAPERIALAADYTNGHFKRGVE